METWLLHERNVRICTVHRRDRDHILAPGSSRGSRTAVRRSEPASPPDGSADRRALHVPRHPLAQPIDDIRAGLATAAGTSSWYPCRSVTGAVLSARKGFAALPSALLGALLI